MNLHLITFRHSSITWSRMAMSGEKRKRPKAVHATFHSTELDQIESWRRVQPEIPGLATAIRVFVIRGLKASTDVPTKERAI
jgi:hypothetical protein